MRKINPVFSYIMTAVILMALWFIMSGKTEIKFLILGAASSLLIAAVCVRTLRMKGCKTDTVYYLLGFVPLRLLPYLCWLIVQIVKSAIYVSGVILRGNSHLDSSVAWFRADYDDPSARALLANSITLTPGTITIDITEDGIYSVHCLTQSVREGLLDGSMQRKVGRVFGEEIDFEPLEAAEAKQPESAKAIASPAGRYRGRYKAGREKQ